MTYGPVPASERAARTAVMRIRKQQARDAYLREAQVFLRWMCERPRAFVVFHKSELKALRTC